MLLSAFDDLLRRQRHTFARCPAWAPELGVRGRTWSPAGWTTCSSIPAHANEWPQARCYVARGEAVALIQSCQKGQRPSYKDLLSFVSSVARMFPNEIQHGILSKHTLADVPPGWLLMEKVFFAELKRLLPFGLPQMCRNFLVSWSHAGLEREMLFRTPVAFLTKRAVQEHKGGHGVDDGCDLKASVSPGPGSLSKCRGWQVLPRVRGGRRDWIRILWAPTAYNGEDAATAQCLEQRSCGFVSCLKTSTRGNSSSSSRSVWTM